MDIFSFFTLLGGLTLFLFGMDRMGYGLKKLSGSELEIVLEKLTCFTHPNVSSEEGQSTATGNLLLDIRLREKPAFALIQALTISESIVSDILTLSAFVYSLPAHYQKRNSRNAKAEAVKIISQLEQLTAYLMTLSNMQLAAKDSHTVNQLLQSISELNGITDHLSHMADLSQSISRQKHPLSLAALKDLRELWSRMDIMLRKLDEAFLKGNYITGMWMERQNSLIQEQIKELKQNHIKRLRNGRCNVETGMFYLDLLTDCEQIALYCTNLFDEAFILDSTEERKG